MARLRPDPGPADPRPSPLARSRGCDLVGQVGGPRGQHRADRPGHPCQGPVPRAQRQGGRPASAGRPARRRGHDSVRGRLAGQSVRHGWRGRGGLGVRPGDDPAGRRGGPVRSGPLGPVLGARPDQRAGRGCGDRRRLRVVPLTEGLPDAGGQGRGSGPCAAARVRHARLAGLLRDPPGQVRHLGHRLGRGRAGRGVVPGRGQRGPGQWEPRRRPAALAQRDRSVPGPHPGQWLVHGRHGGRRGGRCGLPEGGARHLPDRRRGDPEPHGLHPRGQVDEGRPAGGLPDRAPRVHRAGRPAQHAHPGRLRGSGGSGVPLAWRRRGGAWLLDGPRPARRPPGRRLRAGRCLRRRGQRAWLPVVRALGPQRHLAGPHAS